MLSFEEEKEGVSTQISNEEIKRGLWALKLFKAPRIDGFHVGFYQYFWADVKELVCQEVTNIFETREMLEYLNETLISLIQNAKAQKASVITDSLACVNPFIKWSLRS